MQKIVISLLIGIVISGCGGSSKNPTYNVAINNAGDGDVVVNVGSGVITIGEDGKCIVTDENNNTRPCTDEEFASAYLMVME